jgi:dipeptidase
MTSKQKEQLVDLVYYTIIPVISEDLGIWDKDGVNEALSFLVRVINNEKME